MDESATSKNAHHGEINIVVNGKSKKVDHAVLSFDEVVKLAYPTPPSPNPDDVVYIVTFHNADQDRKNGELVAPQTVTVRNGTNFDVKHSFRS